MLPPACPQPAKHACLVLRLSTSSVRHLINLNQTQVPLAAEDGAAVNLFFSAQQFPLRSPSTNRCWVSPCPASAPHPGSCVCPQAGPPGLGLTWLPWEGCAPVTQAFGVAFGVSFGLLHFSKSQNFIFSAGLPPLQ